MGEDQPRPAISAFHATFSLVLQRSGRLGFSATPSDPGPRNCGQFAEASAPSPTRVNSTNKPTIRAGLQPLFALGKLKLVPVAEFIGGVLSTLRQPARQTTCSLNCIWKRARMRRMLSNQATAQAELSVVNRRLILNLNGRPIMKTPNPISTLFPLPRLAM